MFAPLRPRLMLRLLVNHPDQLLQFPNYEGHLTNPYRTEFVYPLVHLELADRPVAPISDLLRKTGSITDVRPAALVRVIRRYKPDLVFSVGLDHASAVTLRARDRFGPGFPTWLVCAWRDQLSTAGANRTRSSELARIFSSIDFLAYEGEAELTGARKFGWTGPALPVSSPTVFDFDRLVPKASLPPSNRRTIAIDCSLDRPDYAVAVLDAMDACAESLQNYMTVVCRPSHPKIGDAVRRIQRTGRFPIMCEPQWSLQCAPELLGSSRVYFGVPHLREEPDFSLIYAATMGAFPVQICKPEESNWADPGLQGLSVAPADTEALKSLVMRVLADDELVDTAAKKNLAIGLSKFSINSADSINHQRRDLFDEIFVGPRPRVPSSPGEGRQLSR
jgi:hypothetical protein